MLDNIFLNWLKGQIILLCSAFFARTLVLVIDLFILNDMHDIHVLQYEGTRLPQLQRSPQCYSGDFRTTSIFSGPHPFCLNPCFVLTVLIPLYRSRLYSTIYLYLLFAYPKTVVREKDTAQKVKRIKLLEDLPKNKLGKTFPEFKIPFGKIEL